MPSCIRSSAISGVMGGQARADAPAAEQPLASGGRFCAGSQPLLEEYPFALLQLDTHARALVDAEEAAGLVIVDAVRADHLAGRFHRVLQGGAEFLVPRLPLLQCAFG